MATINDKLNAVFGFKVNIVSSKTYDANGESRTRYTVQRPNGKKFYHAFQFENGVVIA